MEVLVINATKNCFKCDAVIDPNSRFCNHCGSLQNSNDVIETNERWAYLKQTALFFSIQLLICLLFKYAESLNTFGWLTICDAWLAGIATLFFAYNWDSNKHLLKWPNFSIQKLALYCAIAFTASLIVSYTVGWLNSVLYDKEVDYYYFYVANGHGKIWMICSIAIVPALFEELAYRGFVLQNLTKIIDVNQAIFVTSFMFAIIHLSFLSLFWLIPFALFLAYTRIKEGCIWYGVCVHFCFNLTVCLLEIFK